MSEAARVGDAIHGPEPVASPDNDGSAVAGRDPSTVATTTPAIAGGSPDVFVNGFAALRVDDGGDGWQASAGSTGVFVNGKPAVRAGDATSHGGAPGAVAGGSADVSFGDAAPGTPNDRPHDRSVQLSFVDALGREVEDLVVEVFCPHQPLSTQPASGSATITGLCSSANVSVHKALQAGEWDDSASQGPNPMTIMSAHTHSNGTGGVEAPSGGASANGGASASTTVHAPGPSGTSSSQQTVNVPASNGGSTAVQYTTVHNWMQLVYHAFGHNLPTEDHQLALLGVREASLSGPGRSSEAHVEKLESRRHGDVAHVSFTREKRAQSYNDLLFAAYADRHVKTKQVVDVYECTIDASPSHGKLELPYILEGHMLHATPSGFESYPGKHIALELFRGAHAPHVAAGGSAKAVLDLAHKQLGTKETTTNYTKYNEWYPAPAEFWCAIFVSWVFCHSGFPEIRYTYCGNGADAFKSGAWGTWHGSDANREAGRHRVLQLARRRPRVGPHGHRRQRSRQHHHRDRGQHEQRLTRRAGRRRVPAIEPPEEPHQRLRPREIPGDGAGDAGDPLGRRGPPRAREVREGLDAAAPSVLRLQTRQVRRRQGREALRALHAHVQRREEQGQDPLPRRVEPVREELRRVGEVGRRAPRKADGELGLAHRRPPLAEGPHEVLLPSFLSQSYVDRTFDHIARMHDRHEAHKLRDELEAALLQLSVKI